MSVFLKKFPSTKVFRIDTALLTPVTLTLPGLPASLAGLRIAHVSDLHIRRRRARYRRVARLLGQLDADLVFLTGDYMQTFGDEPIARAVLGDILHQVPARSRVFGVFGNHDTQQFQAMAATLPVRWLNNERYAMADRPVDVLGMYTDRTQHGDALSLLRTGTPPPSGKTPAPPSAPVMDERRLQLMLCHYPMALPTLADLGVDLAFSGHTHGGQFRLPGFDAFYNSSDLPGDLTAGILRHRDTLCLVSRGLGESILPMRLGCPPHLPVYTLQAGPLLGRATLAIENLRPW